MDKDPCPGCANPDAFHLKLPRRTKPTSEFRSEMERRRRDYEEFRKEWTSMVGKVERKDK